MGHNFRRSLVILLTRSVLCQSVGRLCRNSNFNSPAVQTLPNYWHPSSLKNKCNFCDYKRRLYSSTMSCHLKARCEVYPRTEMKRFPVSDEQVPWEVECSNYVPLEFTSPSVLSQPVWADLPDASLCKTFNTIDTEANIDRRSYTGKYDVVDGRPRNPRGRTGVTGRGHLGRWGPNHAGDPLVTRWKRDENGDIVKADDGKPILQFVSVQRRDNGEWALPGGMVNPGENRTAALLREFGEEALNTLEATDDEKEEINNAMKENFKDGHKIYTGYVDDPRNTDNAWMETKALNFHDKDGKSLGAFKLSAGDDAVGVQWMDIDSELKLYASHKDFIKKCVDHLDAHW